MREPGYYWVKCTAKWFVAYWDSEAFNRGWKLVVPLEINETRIKAPDEKPSTVTEVMVRDFNYLKEYGIEPLYILFDPNGPVNIQKLVETGAVLVNNPQLGFASAIEEHIQDVGEYELVLTLRLKK